MLILMTGLRERLGDVGQTAVDAGCSFMASFDEGRLDVSLESYSSVMERWSRAALDMLFGTLTRAAPEAIEQWISTAKVTWDNSQQQPPYVHRVLMLCRCCQVLRVCVATVFVVVAGLIDACFVVF